MKTTATRQQVIEAIQAVNQKRGYSLELNRDEQTSRKYYSFTIKTKSKIPGARISTTGRNMARASWHAHGYLFDEILKSNPEAIILSNGIKIDKNGGNWKDRNIGSIFSPCYYSQTSIL